MFATDAIADCASGLTIPPERCGRWIWGSLPKVITGGTGRARACEYVADFERIGRHALRRAEWKGRLKLFNIYFVHSVEYRSAISLVGVAEGSSITGIARLRARSARNFRARTSIHRPAIFWM